MSGTDVDERPTIVVGVDGSDGSRAAVEFAMEDAVRRRARVRAVAVFQEPAYWAVAYGMSAPPTPAEVTVGLEKATQEVVDDVRARNPGVAEVPVDVVGLIGVPAVVLLHEADDADLLVLGHRGRGALASAVLGSVGLDCVLHARGPVAVVRAGEPTVQPSS